ncbi:hypothetical protein [Micromonospora aurantiaca (nom. illeg.)]|uniref:hypothetical protein n=1 Tax=Micromonospora aurantiaca (nom. illeg.) TaxID=47850 RepID=UPI0036C8FD72
MLMPWTSRRPVPAGPRHRRDWRAAWRRCTCGLRWPCPDRGPVPPAEPPPPVYRATAPVPPPRWQREVTALHPLIGRAGNLTPAQAYRAGSGR